jgi:hypothetical protein
MIYVTYKVNLISHLGLLSKMDNSCRVYKTWIRAQDSGFRVVRTDVLGFFIGSGFKVKVAGA